MRLVAVVGAGASGMLSALTAAEDPRNRVVVFERQARSGRKLMATGNGRCNLTNTGASPAHYHGEDPAFVRPALAAFPPEETLRYFRSLGLLTAEEYGGRVFPLSNSANSVADVLRYALLSAGAEVRAAAPVTALRRADGGFVLAAGGEELRADRVIVACGGAAGERLGGGKDGYELLGALGHTRTALRPALAPLVTDPVYPRALKGVKADAELTLSCPEGVLARSRGEVLFTETGVSGPAAFDLSRAAAERAGAPAEVRMDFLCACGGIAEVLRERRARMPALPASDLLTGILHNRLGRMVMKYAGVDGGKAAASLTDGELEAAERACRDFALPLRGTGGFADAQVTAGGVRTSEFDAATLRSRLVPGLYACGEVLDVDGDCGGYNLQWAWASGRLAGRLG